MNSIIAMQDIRTGLASIARRAEAGESFVVVRNSRPAFKIMPMENNEPSLYPTSDSEAPRPKGGASERNSAVASASVSPFVETTAKDHSSPLKERGSLAKASKRTPLSAREIRSKFGTSGSARNFTPADLDRIINEVHAQKAPRS